MPLCLGFCVAVLVLAVACGSKTAPAGPSSIEEAYRSAHPQSARPEALATQQATIAGLRRELASRLSAAVPLVLPREFPTGWGLAAPYIAVGDGSALPNPETWATGYRAAFTDGQALLIVTVNPVRLPGDGPWAALPVSIAGRSVAWRRDSETIVLATPAASDWRAALIGVGVGRGRLEQLAASLAVL
jgi:hypothetical protein